MEGFQDRFVVVQLSERSLEDHQEGVVDTGMADVMSYGRYQESQGIKRPEQGCNGRRVFASVRWNRGGWKRGQRAKLHYEEENGLKNINHVAKVVVVHEVVVCSSAGHQKSLQIICITYVRLGVPATQFASHVDQEILTCRQPPTVKFWHSQGMLQHKKGSV